MFSFASSTDRFADLEGIGVAVSGRSPAGGIAECVAEGGVEMDDLGSAALAVTGCGGVPLEVGGVGPSRRADAAWSAPDAQAAASTATRAS